MSAVRSVFKELCAGERAAWQTLAQRKKLPLHEMRNLAKSKSIQALACCNVVKFLRCIAVFHTQFRPPLSLCHFFHSFAVFAHESAVRAFETENPKAKNQNANQNSNSKHYQKPEVGSTPFNLRTSSQPSVTISCSDWGRTAAAELQQRNEKFSFYLN